MECADPTSEARIASVAGVPLISAARASKQAASALSVRRLAGATPYGSAANEVIESFLEGGGIEVTCIQGLDHPAAQFAAKAGRLTTEDVLGLDAQTDRAAAEAIYYPFTAVPSLEAITLLEARTGKPAFSSTTRRILGRPCGASD